MKKEQYVIGVDYGTDSVRSIIVNAANGQEIASSVFYYPRWKEGKYCDPSLNQFRQHPLDYIEGLEESIRKCLEQAGPSVAAAVEAISVDTTGSTPVAVDRSGTPLALLPGFENNPNALFILWKDHTAVKEAAEINAHAKRFDINYLQYVGGIYSSEWFWAKLLHIVRIDEQVRKACYSWVEHCDWIPFLLTGGNKADDIKRSVCAAGHKALWAKEYGGLPPNEFFSSLDPLLNGFTDRLFTETYTADKPAGTISIEWAKRLGLKEKVVVGIGAFDCHMGAVGGQIEPYYLSKVMGTSTCDMLVAPIEEVKDVLVRGICGQVSGSIIPGMLGMEAGQSAFGDAYAWLKNLLAWPLHLLKDDHLRQQIEDKIITSLSVEAANIPLQEEDEMAIEWLNGRRTPDANQLLKGAFTGLHLGTDALRMFKALVEATCFGAKGIVERFEQQGIPVKGLIGLGGVAKKSPYIMQVMADVTEMPIRIHKSEQTCAAGAAMFAATAAGIYGKVEDAMQAMGQGFDVTYHPDETRTALYAKRYKKYKELGNYVEQLNPTYTNMKAKSKVDQTYNDIREAAYKANMQLHEYGLVLFTFGNASAADRKKGVFAIKPSGVPYKDLSPDIMVIVDFDGKVVDGKYRPSSDTLTHAILYKHWATIGGIVHTHSTYATAWAQSQRDIPIFGTTHADYTAADIPCAPPMSDKMIKGNYEYETGFQIINAFKNKKLSYEEVEMVLVGNHAPFTWGKTAEKAAHNSAVLEEIARMAWLTEKINPNAPRLKNALIKKHYERKHGPDRYYGQITD